MPVSRITIPFLLDLVTVSTYADLQTLQNSGTIDRMNTADITSLPFPFRQYFSLSRFYHTPTSSWFQPMRSSSDPTYAPCRAFLDDRFARARDMTPFATRAADILCGPDPSDRDLVDVCVRAIWQYMVDVGHPGFSDSLIDDVMKQIGTITEVLNPFTVFPAAKPTARVFDHAEQTLKQTANDEFNKLPKAVIPDVAHVFFAMENNAVPFLREIAKNPHKELDDILLDLAVVPTVLRMCKEDGTLGGLLPEDKPARSGKTIVQIDTKAIGEERRDAYFAFAVQPGRECAAEAVIRKFLVSVQEELRRRQTSVSS